MEKFGIVPNAIWHIEICLALMENSAVANVNMQLLHSVKHVLPKNRASNQLCIQLLFVLI